MERIKNGGSRVEGSRGNGEGNEEGSVERRRHNVREMVSKC